LCYFFENTLYITVCQKLDLTFWGKASIKIKEERSWDKKKDKKEELNGWKKATG
jgi:hypothetical protein